MADAALPGQAQFTQPVRPILTMLIIVALVAAGAYVAFPRIEAVVLANPWLNGVIVAVFLIGVLACLWQVFQLIGAVRWIESFARDQPDSGVSPAPPLLTPLAALLRGRGTHRHISASSARSILDSVATRLDEVRDITRYIINLLIFLGLLGTFYGLATTVPAVVDTIRSLNISAEDGGAAAFADLMNGLEAQLGGMGTAFSSSLLGLAGSLVVGLLELFAGHGQNRFYRDLEEWLSSITRIGMAGGDGDAAAAIPPDGTDIAALAAAIGDLARRQADIARTGVDQQAQLSELTEIMRALPDRLAAARHDAERMSLDRLAESQARLTAFLEAQEEAQPVDAESRMRLRSIDVQLLRILEEVSAGRHESLSELREDLARIARALEGRGR